MRRRRGANSSAGGWPAAGEGRAVRARSRSTRQAVTNSSSSKKRQQVGVHVLRDRGRRVSRGGGLAKGADHPGRLLDAPRCPCRGRRRSGTAGMSGVVAVVEVAADDGVLGRGQVAGGDRHAARTGWGRIGRMARWAASANRRPARTGCSRRTRTAANRTAAALTSGTSTMRTPCCGVPRAGPTSRRRLPAPRQPQQEPERWTRAGSAAGATSGARANKGVRTTVGPGRAHADGSERDQQTAARPAPVEPGCFGPCSSALRVGRDRPSGESLSTVAARCPLTACRRSGVRSSPRAAGRLLGDKA